MPTLEQRCINALLKVTFPVASWDKRFFRNLPSAGEGLSPKQTYWLMKLTHRYRRQITDKAAVSDAQAWLSTNPEPK